jgi:hypothetical protein
MQQYVRRTNFNPLEFSNFLFKLSISSVYIRRHLRRSVMVDLVRLVFPFDMPVILFFALLVFFHGHTQLVGAKANYSVALHLAVRSPYLSCWLP